ncbi:MAG: hypothetical protein R3A78_15935 [Polyangiales bacterium]
MRVDVRILSLGLVAFAACQGDAGGDAIPSHVNEALRSCGESRAERMESIADAVLHLNELPASADVNCFVASWPRPLRLVATSAVTSAQPADGPTNPRVFALYDGLALSVVPTGVGSTLVEFGEWVSDTRTRKGELELPMLRPIADRAPYDYVLYEGGGTRCGLCHGAEMPDPDIEGAFQSIAFRPVPEYDVELALLEQEHDTCIETEDESERCAMFHALFDFGPVEATSFADDVRFFGR